MNNNNNNYTLGIVNCLRLENSENPTRFLQPNLYKRKNRVSISRVHPFPHSQKNCKFLVHSLPTSLIFFRSRVQQGPKSQCFIDLYLYLKSYVVMGSRFSRTYPPESRLSGHTRRGRLPHRSRAR